MSGGPARQRNPCERYLKWPPTRIRHAVLLVRRPCLLLLLLLSTTSQSWILLSSKSALLGQSADTKGRAFSFKASNSFAPRSITDTKGDSMIEHLAQHVEFRSSIDQTIQELQRHIPVVVSRPLETHVAQRTYTTDTKLVVSSEELGDIELVSSLEELVTLTNTIVMAVQVSARASNFLSLLGVNASSTARATANVKSRVALDPSLKSLQVKWKTELFPLVGQAMSTPGNKNKSGGPSSAMSTLEGLSELILDQESGKIDTHRLLRVQWNGQDQDATTIGQTLSLLRQTIQNFQKFPFGQTFGSGTLNLFNQIRDGYLYESTEQLPTESNASSTAPLFVLVTPATNRTKGFTWVPVQDYNFSRHSTGESSSSPENVFQSTSMPLPGTDTWTQYAASFQAIRRFVSETIPNLSQQANVELIRSLFLPTARFYTVDESLLLEGSYRIANFYQSLAAVRSRTFGSWNLDHVELIYTDGDNFGYSVSNSSRTQVRIYYTTTTGFPGTTSAITASGCDRYVLIPDMDGSLETGAISANWKIGEVHQEKVSIAGNDSPLEALWAMRSIATAVETGRFRNNEDALWKTLLQRLNNGIIASSVPLEANSYEYKKVLPDAQSPLVRSDQTASMVYRIMTNLHLEMISLVNDTDMAATLNPNLCPPAAEYMTDNVKLLGYIGEVLLSGRQMYTNSVVFFMRSLKSAIHSGRLLVAKEPDVHVELKATGDVRLDFTLHMIFLPLVGLPGLNRVAGTDKANGLGASVPLTVKVVSDYLLDHHTGRIMQHRLVESRINGQLTPGDIISRWIQRQRGEELASPDETVWLHALMDTVRWLETMNGSTKKSKK